MTAGHSGRIDDASSRGIEVSNRTLTSRPSLGHHPLTYGHGRVPLYSSQESTKKVKVALIKRLERENFDR
ncbi:hypothetical protein PanWU01x14_052930 [Parasponia andersonii]|uniref:Uncharacterized protein n=1 Tax=Parasponia andersonii TaxID=3476 RepID=A0A2P5DLC5_PARAD|nr:hypothetical protein PanWU01x14_052930 [Parasponia andersonii]